MVTIDNSSHYLHCYFHQFPALVLVVSYLIVDLLMTQSLLACWTTTTIPVMPAADSTRLVKMERMLMLWKSCGYYADAGGMKWP